MRRPSMQRLTRPIFQAILAAACFVGLLARAAEDPVKASKVAPQAIKKAVPQVKKPSAPVQKKSLPAEKKSAPTQAKVSPGSDLAKDSAKPDASGPIVATSVAKPGTTPGFTN